MVKPLTRITRWLLSDPKWLIGTLIAAAGVAVAVIAISPAPAALRAIHVDQPSVTPETRGDFLVSQNEPAGALAPDALQQQGFAILTNLTTQGYDGQWLQVDCIVVDSTTGAIVVPQPHSLQATGGAQTTEPCFVPRPGSRRDTFVITVQINDGHGTHLQTSPSVTER